MRVTASAWVAVGLAAALHAAAGLALTRAFNSDGAPPSGGAGMPHSSALQVRTLASPRGIPAAPAQASLAPRAGIPPQRAAPAPPPADSNAESPVPDTSEGADPPRPPFEAIPESEEDQGDRSADDGYLRRGALTVVPTVREPVPLVYPHAPDAPPHATAVVSLFIDETGEVQRIRIEEPGLPAPFEAAVRQAFGSARFTPGEVDGQPVRSLIRIEVRFDVDELPPQ